MAIRRDAVKRRHVKPRGLTCWTACSSVADPHGEYDQSPDRRDAASCDSSERTLTRPRWLLLFSAAVAGGIVLLAVTHREETREFWQDANRLSLIAVISACLLILGQVSFQALRMWAVIPRDSPLSVARIGYIFTVGDWTNIFIPARGGDALKILLMTRVESGHRMSLTKATGAMLADKVVDIGTLTVLCAVTGLMNLVAAKTRTMLPVFSIVIGAGGILALVLVAIRRGWPGWWAARRAWLRDLARGLSALKDPQRCSASVSFSVAARLAEVLALRVLCVAMGFPLSLPQVLLALVIVNLSVSIPVSIASLGIYEAGLAYGLTRSGMPLPVGIMIATTHHVLELSGITLSAAGYALANHWMTRKAALTARTV
jgi:glycosyltransferase 2 family protein